MTENKLAVRPTSALAIPQRMSLEEVKERARMVIKAGLAPTQFTDDEKGISSLALVALKGMDVGMSFMEAVNSFYVVNGRIGEMTHQLVHCLRQHGHDYMVTESTAESCTVVFYHRNGREMPPFTMTYDEIREAGWDMQRTGQKPLYSKSATRKIMVRYRAISNGIRAYFPDVVYAVPPHVQAQLEHPELEDGQEADTIPSPEAMDATYTTLEDEPAQPRTKAPAVHWSAFPANREVFTAKTVALTLSKQDMLAALREACDLNVQKVSEFPGTLEQALQALEDYVTRQAGLPTDNDQLGGMW